MMIMRFGLIFLAVIPSLTFGKFIAFRCSFLNEKYELNAANQNPVFGSRPMPLKLESKEDFKFLLSEIQRITEGMIADYNLNTVDDYLKFYNDFIKAVKPIDTFYSSYKPLFHGRMGLINFPIELLRKIEKDLDHTYPGIGKSMILAGAQHEYLTFPETELAKIGASRKTASRAKKTNLVFGAIKFVHNVHVGHILLDPGHGVVRPIVVMENGGKPMYDEILWNKDERHNIIYEMFPSVTNIIIARKVSQNATSTENTKNNAVHVIYVGRSHCTVLDVTQKLDLLSSHRFLIKRNNAGNALAGLSISTLPPSMRDVNKKDPEVNIFTKVRDGIDVSLNIKLKNFKERETNNEALTSNENKLILTVAHDLGLTAESLYTKLAKLEELMGNDDFLLQLNKIYDNIFKTGPQIIKAPSTPRTNSQRAHQYRIKPQEEDNGMFDCGVKNMFKRIFCIT